MRSFTQFLESKIFEQAPPAAGPAGSHGLCVGADGADPRLPRFGNGHLVFERAQPPRLDRPGTGLCHTGGAAGGTGGVHRRALGHASIKRVPDPFFAA